MVRVGVIGASGYAGAELVRYLLGHPGVTLTYLASATYKGRPLSEAYPSFSGYQMPICEQYDAEEAADKADLFFQAQGNGVGMKIAPELLDFGKKFVDVPADFRLKDLAVHKHYYSMDHAAPDLVGKAVYGISELRPDEISNADLVANPGCYATAAILALAPLAADELVDPASIVVDAKSGVSGAGRSKVQVSGLFCEVNEGVKAYAIASHRHTPEIEQEISLIAGEQIKLNFTPHLIPMNRGILATAYANLAEGGASSTAEVLGVFKDFYADKPFVVVLDEGKQPSTKDVFGSNFCHIGVVVDQRTGRVIVTSAIDNMGKGAAGQAVQNMNLMCGFDEDDGLIAAPVYP